MTESMSKTITIYAPTSPRGKVLKAALPRTSLADWKVKLIDEEELDGTLTEYDGGVELVKKMTMEALRAADIVFFTENPAKSSEYVEKLLAETSFSASRLLVDLSDGIEGSRSEGVVSRENYSSSTKGISLAPLANPLAIGLHHIISLCHAIAPLEAVNGIVQVPVSELGNAGIEALHGQIVELMNFNTPTETIFGSQLVFNMIPGYGHVGSPTQFSSYEERIIRQTLSLFGNPDFALSLTSAMLPVFYAFSAQLHLQFINEVDITRLCNGIGMGDGIAFSLDSLAEGEQFDGPLAASEDQDIQVVRCIKSSQRSNEVTMWLQFDNINAHCVRHAIAIAEAYASH